MKRLLDMTDVELKKLCKEVDAQINLSRIHEDLSATAEDAIKRMYPEVSGDETTIFGRAMAYALGGDADPEVFVTEFRQGVEDMMVQSSGEEVIEEGDEGMGRRASEDLVLRYNESSHRFTADSFHQHELLRQLSDEAGMGKKIYFKSEEIDALLDAAEKHDIGIVTVGGPDYESNPESYESREFPWVSEEVIE